MIELQIDSIPLTWKAAFVGSHGAFSPRYNESKFIKEEMREQYSGPFLEGALWCDLFFFVPIPKSASKKKKALMLSGELRPVTRKNGDRINLGKYYEDLMQGIVFEDDAAIVDGRVAKWYSENPRIEIKIRKI